MYHEQNQEGPQEAPEGPSEGRRALLGVPHPRTFDGALYEAYRAGWCDRDQTAVHSWSASFHHMRQAFTAWRRRFVTLPEVD